MGFLPRKRRRRRGALGQIALIVIACAASTLLPSNYPASGEHAKFSKTLAFRSRDPIAGMTRIESAGLPALGITEQPAARSVDFRGNLPAAAFLGNSFLGLFCGLFYFGRGVFRLFGQPQLTQPLRLLGPQPSRGLNIVPDRLISLLKACEALRGFGFCRSSHQVFLLVVRECVR